MNKCSTWNTEIIERYCGTVVIILNCSQGTIPSSVLQNWHSYTKLTQLHKTKTVTHILHSYTHLTQLHRNKRITHILHSYTEIKELHTSYTVTQNKHRDIDYSNWEHSHLFSESKKMQIKGQHNKVKRPQKETKYSTMKTTLYTGQPPIWAHMSLIVLIWIFLNPNQTEGGQMAHRVLKALFLGNQKSDWPQTRL